MLPDSVPDLLLSCSPPGLSCSFGREPHRIVENDVVSPSQRCVSADERFQAFTLSNSLNNVHAIDHYLGTSPWFRSDPTLTESGEQTQGPSLYARHVDLHNSSGPY